MPTPETVVPAPADSEATQYIHKVSGVLVNVRPVAFKIAGDIAEPILFPRLDASWDAVTHLPNGYLACHGRQAINIQTLCTLIKNGGQSS